MKKAPLLWPLTSLLGVATLTTCSHRPVQRAPRAEEINQTRSVGAQPQNLRFPADEPFRGKQPAPTALRDFATPKAQIFKLDNGLRVYLIERHIIPTLSLQLVIPGGTIDDPRGKEGMASLCTDLIAEGTKTLDKISFEEALADLGSQVNASANVDELTFSLRTLTRNFIPSLKLFAEMIRRPGLRKTEFIRLVRQAQTRLVQLKASPKALARRVRDGIVFGPRHPQGRVASETSLRAVTLQDCQLYFRRRIRPKEATLFVVGATDARNLRQRLQRGLYGWYGRPDEVEPAGRPRPRAGRIFFVDVPGAKQTVIYAMHAGPPRRAKDYFASSLMTSILGGNFASRINMNIREKNGYAYGAYGGFHYTRRRGLFLASAAVRNDAASAAASEIYNELRTLHGGTVTDDELARVSNGAVLSLPARFSSGHRILGTYRRLRYFGLPLNYYDRYIDRVRAVTKDDVHAAAKRRLQPSQLKFLFVGDARAIVPQLDAAIRGSTLPGSEIVYLDTDGNLAQGSPKSPSS